MKSRNVDLNSWWAEMTVVEQELLTLPEHLRSPPVFSVTRSSVFCVMFCRLLFVLLYMFFLAIILPVLLRYAYSDYTFGIFTLVLIFFLYISGKRTMIISRFCLLFLICKGVVSFVRLPCLTNDSKDLRMRRKPWQIWSPTWKRRLRTSTRK